jgi:hypothetical protein
VTLLFRIIGEAVYYGHRYIHQHQHHTHRTPQSQHIKSDGGYRVNKKDKSLKIYNVYISVEAVHNQTAEDKKSSCARCYS